MNLRLNSVLRSIFLVLLISGLGSTVFAQTFAYVVETGIQDVAVIDTSTNTLVTQIPVEGPRDIALSPDGSHVYVSSVQRTPDFGIISFHIIAIDTATNSISGDIVTDGPGAFTVSPDSSKVYRSLQGGVAVIDAATNTITTVIPTLFDGHVVCSPDGTRLYVGNSNTGGIYIIDTATNTVIDTIPNPPFGLSSIAISPDGSRLYASHDDETRVIDTATKIEIGSIPQGGLITMAVTPDGKHIWGCGTYDFGPFWVLDTTTFSVTTVTETEGSWYQAGITPDGTLAYLADGIDDAVVVWDTTTLLPVATIQLKISHPPAFPGSRPEGMAVGAIPPAIPFAAFSVSKLQINSQGFSDNGSFTLGAGHAAATASTSTLDPVTQNVTLTAGSYTLMIPAGSFRKDGTNLHWKFDGQIGSVRVNADIKQQNKSTTQFDYSFGVNGPNLTSALRPIRVSLKIGLNVGSSNVP
jgi:40-residue YVTN family beta-propeller repeat